MDIRCAGVADIAGMVALSHQKRLAYAAIQSQFWRYAEGAEITQHAWFESLLMLGDYIVLVAEVDCQMSGFIIGHIVEAPAVYDPGGLTVTVDDFCVMSNEWMQIGVALNQALCEKAKEKGVVQMIVVCGAHDLVKKQFLVNAGLSIASEWYVGRI